MIIFQSLAGFKPCQLALSYQSIDATREDLQLEKIKQEISTPTPEDLLFIPELQPLSKPKVRPNRSEVRNELIR